jgi:hypothetical protein
VAPGIVPQNRQERLELTLSDWTPQPDMRCVLQERPLELPAASALLDVEELQGDLDQMREALDSPRGSILMSIGYSGTGRPDDFHIVETTLADTTLAQDIARLVDRRLYRLEAGEPFGVRLKLTLGEETSFDVGRREECYPRWAEAPAIGTIDEDPGADEARAIARSDESALRVYMNANGVITDAYALGQLPGNATVAQLIEASREADIAGTAFLDRRPVGFWFTAHTGVESRRHIADGGYATYSDRYCSEFWRPGDMCDPFYRSAFRPYGGYYGYSPYGYYGYGTYGWWGMVPWYYVPSPTRPGGGGQTPPPADTVVPPGKVIPPPSVPPSRPTRPGRPAINVGRPNFPSDDAQRRVLEERADAERARREAGAQRPGERQARGTPLRAAPDAGDVSTGSAGRARPPQDSRSIIRPRGERPDPGARRASPAASPSAPRVERSRPSSSGNASARPSSRGSAVRSGGSSGSTARPSPSSARPSSGESRSARPSSGSARPAPSSARPSSGARPSPSSARPSSGGSSRPSPSARPSPATARPSSPPPRQVRPSSTPSSGSRSSGGAVRPSTPPPDSQ